MAQQAAKGEAPIRERAPSGLLLRIASASVMAPAVLAAVYAGFPFFHLLVAVAAILLAYEWEGLCGGGRFGRSGYALVAASLLAVLTVVLGRPEMGLAVAALGAVAVAGVRMAEGRENALWAGVGAVYIAVPCIAVLWLRGDGPAGLTIILWLLVTVWAADIGAYAFGRLIGGPKLAPRVSPNKTWSGLAGGVGCAAAVGAVAGALLAGEAADAVRLALVSGGLGALSQGGDLIESIAKRRFGVKDTSRLIPGHGGLFDRVDSLLVTAPAVALLMLFTGTLVP